MLCHGRNVGVDAFALVGHFSRNGSKNHRHDVIAGFFIQGNGLPEFMETAHSPGAVPGKNAEATFLVLNITRLEARASGRDHTSMEQQTEAQWPDRTRDGLKAQWVLIIVVVEFVAGWVVANLLPG